MTAKKPGLYLAIIVLFFLHNDFWYWFDDQLILGLPAGLTYHILYCFAVSLLMYVLVSQAWPFSDTEEEGS